MDILLCIRLLQVNKRAGLSPGCAAQTLSSRVDRKRKAKADVFTSRAGKKRRVQLKKIR